MCYQEQGYQSWQIFFFKKKSGIVGYGEKVCTIMIYDAPVPEIEHVAPALALKDANPASGDQVCGHAASAQQLLGADAMTAITSGVYQNSFALDCVNGRHTLSVDILPVHGNQMQQRLVPLAHEPLTASPQWASQHSAE